MVLHSHIPSNVHKANLHVPCAAYRPTGGLHRLDRHKLIAKKKTLDIHIVLLQNRRKRD